MNKQTQAELHILDRVLYLLEEHSIETAVEQDSTFRNYIEGLYFSVSQKASSLS